MKQVDVPKRPVITGRKLPRGKWRLIGTRRGYVRGKLVRISRYRRIREAPGPWWLLLYVGVFVAVAAAIALVGLAALTLIVLARLALVYGPMVIVGCIAASVLGRYAIKEAEVNEEGYDHEFLEYAEINMSYRGVMPLSLCLALITGLAIVSHAVVRSANLLTLASAAVPLLLGVILTWWLGKKIIRRLLGAIEPEGKGVGWMPQHQINWQVTRVGVFILTACLVVGDFAPAFLYTLRHL